MEMPLGQEAVQGVETQVAVVDGRQVQKDAVA
jgi:hypothetical protein